MPQQTIKAIIKLNNHMITDDSVLNMLLVQFDELNGQIVPRVGRTYKIPVMD